MIICFPQYASLTKSLSISCWKLFSAFATAEEIVFLISLEILLSEKVKSLIAISTFFPTIDFNIGLSFLVLDLIFLLIDPKRMIFLYFKLKRWS